MKIFKNLYEYFIEDGHLIDPWWFLLFTIIVIFLLVALPLIILNLF